MINKYLFINAHTENQNPSWPLLSEFECHYLLARDLRLRLSGKIEREEKANKNSGEAWGGQWKESREERKEGEKAKKTEICLIGWAPLIRTNKTLLSTPSESCVMFPWLLHFLLRIFSFSLLATHSSALLPWKQGQMEHSILKNDSQPLSRTIASGPWKKDQREGENQRGLGHKVSEETDACLKEYD